MEKPKAFVLYPNQWGPLSCLTDEQLGRLLRHIFCWLNDESLDIKKEEQLVEPDILLAFRFMQMQINIDIEKYQQTSEKRRIAANKRWANHANDANAFFAMHKKEKENEKESEKENEKESEKESENESEKENEKEKESSSQAAEDNSDVSEFGSAAWQRNFIAFFNRCVEGSNIPRIRTLTAERIEALRKLREAIKANPSQMRTTEIVFKQAARSDFLNGRGRKNKFQATFDWLIKLENYIHVMEGNYP